MTYRYEKVDLLRTPRFCYHFSISKIKKLYPLHIITMCCAIVLSIASIIHHGFRIKLIVMLFFEIILNTTLLQTWIPNSSINVSLNGVAWYLSVTLFLYFLFPWIKRIVESNPIANLFIICGIILFAEIMGCIPFIYFFGIHSSVYKWYMYCFPIFRVGDFFIGCVLKRIYFERGLSNLKTNRATAYEVLATTITILVFLWLKQEQSSILFQALRNWTTIYIPLAAMWVTLFAANKGCLTRLLTNDLTIYIGDISAYAFLIHYVITQYTSQILTYLNVVADGWIRVLLVFAELAASVLLSIIYKNVHKRLIKNRFFENRKPINQ